MRGRDFTHDNLMWVIQYLQGRGTKLHWLERKDPDARQNSGHRPNPEDPNAYRFAPKSETNRPSLPSHSSNPKFNGENEAKERERMKKFLGQPEVVDAANGYWLAQAKALVGNNHSETARIQRVVSSAFGSPRQQYEAGLREQRIIENERARGR